MRFNVVIKATKVCARASFAVVARSAPVDVMLSPSPTEVPAGGKTTVTVKATMAALPASDALIEVAIEPVNASSRQRGYFTLPNDTRQKAEVRGVMDKDGLFVVDWHTGDKAGYSSDTRFNIKAKGTALLVFKGEKSAAITVKQGMGGSVAEQHVGVVPPPVTPVPGRLQNLVNPDLTGAFSELTAAHILYAGIA